MPRSVALRINGLHLALWRSVGILTQQTQPHPTDLRHCYVIFQSSVAKTGGQLVAGKSVKNLDTWISAYNSSFIEPKMAPGHAAHAPSALHVPPSSPPPPEACRGRLPTMACANRLQPRRICGTPSRPALVFVRCALLGMWATTSLTDALLTKLIVVPLRISPWPFAAAWPAPSPSMPRNGSSARHLARWTANPAPIVC